MKLQKRSRGVAGTCRDFACVRSLGDAEQQADHQITPKQPAEPFGKFGGTAIEKYGRLSPSHDLTQGGTTRLASYGVERLRHLGRVDRLADRQSEHRNDRWISYLADELRPEGSKYVRECFAIARHGKVSGHLQSPRARADASDEHFLLVAHQRVQFSLRNARVRGDLKRAGRRIATLRERREGCIEDARAHRRFVAAFLALL